MPDNIPLGQWSGSDATDQLRHDLAENARKTSRQNLWLLVMTGAILALTLVIAGLTVVLVLR